MELFKNHQSRRVQLLRDSVARKIAAGEVIDRPFSVVRELLDNAIDAEATEIHLSLEQGGLKLIRLADNGKGMSSEDLKLCWLPHATSKITEVEDLESIHSLGFRGEALSSISSCSRLEILSKQEEDEAAWKLTIHGGQERELTPARGRRGTVVEVRDLFYDLPARRRFMKAPSTETKLCRKAFLEKALPFPEIGFHLQSEGKTKLTLPAATLKARVVQAFEGRLPGSMLEELSFSGDHFSLRIIAGSPDLYRKDRRQIQIFVNRRPVDEYAFIQAVQYGYSQVLPGGMFPSAFVFLEVNPALVDFNIHPAKREARFRDKGSLHKAIVQLLTAHNAPRREQASRIIQTAARPTGQQDLNHSFHQFNPPTPSAAAERPLPGKPSTRLENNCRHSNSTGAPSYRGFIPPRPLTSTQEFLEKQPFPDNEEKIFPEQRFIYHGQMMNLFLLVEKEGKLLIIDQHAAHERILYNQLKEQGASSQRLLVPWEIDAQEEEKAFLLAQKDVLDKLGFKIKEEGNTLLITAVPASAQGDQEEVINTLIQEAGDPGSWEKRLYALLSCRSAIKDGEVLHPSTAQDLITQTLNLKEPRCPHGRPVWFELSREELFLFLGRTV